MPATKTYATYTIHEDGMWLPQYLVYPVIWLTVEAPLSILLSASSMVGLKTVTYAKMSPQMVNPRDLAGERRRRRRKPPKTALSPGQNQAPSCDKLRVWQGEHEEYQILRSQAVSRDSLVVRTSRCGRDNPGSNPGHGIYFFLSTKTECGYLNCRINKRSHTHKSHPKWWTPEI